MIDINESRIKEFLERGIENLYPNRKFVEDRLKSGDQLKIYLGIDPTGPSLHIGHAIVLKKLGELQKMGHKIILLIGDFTALSGDPDKTEVRNRITAQEIRQNAKNYKKQASIFLSFSGRNKAELKHNSKWLGKLKFEDVIDLASHFTVEQMLKRDLFKKRIDKGTPLYIHEFMYPLMQAYDSVVMDVDGEMGGNDQTFNMLTGRTLMKQMSNKEKFVVTTKLLVDKEGKKMGKTEGNMITFEDSPDEMFGKVMSWTDEMIIPGFELLTDDTNAEINDLKQEMAKGGNPKQYKTNLAKKIVKTFYSKEAGDKATENFINIFQKGGTPENSPIYKAQKGEALDSVLMASGVTASLSAARRLVEQGAIKDMETKEPITSPKTEIRNTTYKIGRKFLKVETN